MKLMCVNSSGNMAVKYLKLQIPEEYEDIVDIEDEVKTRILRQKQLSGGGKDSRRNSTIGGISLLEEIPEEEDEDKFAKATTLADSRVSMGRDVFRFNTPKKAGSMALKAMEELSKTPKSGKTPNSKAGTPKSGRKQLVTPNKYATPNKYVTPNKRSASNTPTRKSGSGKKRSIAPPTPQSALKKVRRTIHRTEKNIETERYSDDDESEEDENSDSDEDSENDENTKPILGPPATPRTPARKGRAVRRGITRVDTNSLADSYFEAQHSRVITSDRTLSRQNMPRLSEEEVAKLLEGGRTSLRYQQEIAELIADHKVKFTKWLSLLHRGYSIITYGLGSKKSLLQDFHSEMLGKNEDCLVVNGYFPSLTIKSILNGISSDILDLECGFTSTTEHIEAIHAALEDDLYLIIHNIDGPMLRNDKAQTCLAHLSNHPRVHLLCSLDHINAPLIWDQFKLAKFNFIWFDCTTFLPYKEEASGESVMVKASGGLQLASITHVLAALTPNAKKIFLALARYQVEHQESNYQGISFMELYSYCRTDFLVTSDLELKAQLTEFSDHKLISSKRGGDGAEYLTIPLDKATLSSFLESFEDK